MITIEVADVYPWLLVFLRTTGLLMLIPVFSGMTIPPPVRVGIAAILALLVTPLAGDLGPVPATVPGLVRIFIHELLAGLLMGLATRLVFYGLEMAGQLISTEIGLVLSNTIDPITHATATPFNTLLFYLGANLFLITGADHGSIVALARSFQVFPPTAAFDPATADRVVVDSSRIFLVMMEVAAPVVALNFLVNLAMAALDRAASSLEVYSASFSVRILAGLIVFGLTLGITAQHLLSEMSGTPDLMLRFLR